MNALLFGAVALFIVLALLHGFTKVNPRNLAITVKAAGGVGALAGAALLAIRGRIDLALLLGSFGLGLLGWMPWSIPGFGARTRKSAGQVSRVRSAFVEMELEHDTGIMRGTVLAGPHSGKSLDDLDIATLTAYLPDLDEDSRALVMAYLDRREPGWRDNVQSGAAAGPGSWNAGKMTEEEAHQILGLQTGASLNDIARAHRALMKKLHPDQGGSTYLAARVNEAKDVLTRRHR